MKGDRYYLVGTICGAVGLLADVVLIGITPQATFHTSASQGAQIAALSFAALGYLVALMSARNEGKR